MSALRRLRHGPAPLWLALTAAFISGAFPVAALVWLVGVR